MTSFARPSNGEPMGEEQCAREVEAENSRALGITGEPVDRVVWKDSQALPQYIVGHGVRIREICQTLDTFNHWIIQEQPDLIIAAIGKVARNRPDERRGSSAISTMAKS